MMKTAIGDRVSEALTEPGDIRTRLTITMVLVLLVVADSTEGKSLYPP